MATEYINVFNKNSKEYYNYITNEIKKANENGKKTALFVCDTYFPTYDGVVNVFEAYAKGLMANGYNVFAFVPAFCDKVYIKSCPVIAAKSVFSKKLNYQVPIPAFDFKAKKLLKSLKIDVIHCHSPFFMGQYALKLHKKRKIKMVATFHSQYKQDLKKNTNSNFLTNLL